MGFSVALAAAAAILGFTLSLPESSMSGTADGTQSRALTPAQKKAKAKAIAKCKKIKSESRRKRCVRNVNERYRPDPKPGKTWKVEVWDNFYVPGDLEIKLNDVIEWVWAEESREGHNVSLRSGPKGVSPYDFESDVFYAKGSKVRRQMRIPGTYDLICSLHYQMRMQVKVTR